MRRLVLVASTLFLSTNLAQGSGGGAVVLQLEPADANVASLDITVHTKGSSEAKTVSVPIAQ